MQTFTVTPEGLNGGTLKECLVGGEYDPSFKITGPRSQSDLLSKMELSSCALLTSKMTAFRVCA